MDVVILAAGKSTRMKSKTSKVLHHILGRPVLSYVVDLAKGVQAEKTIVVVADQDDSIENIFGDELLYAVQKKQLGTGDALRAAIDLIESDTTLVLYGDAPFLRPESLEAFLAFHQDKDLSILSVNMPDPFNYGRILRGDGGVEKIVEEKDCTEQQREIKEINSGILLMKTAPMKEALGKLKSANAQGEYYLTDLVEIFAKEGRKVDAFVLADPEETVGINNRKQLAQAREILQHRILEKHLDNGVTIIDPKRVYIEPDVEIASDVEIWPDCYLLGSTKIEEDVLLGPGVYLKNCEVHQGVHMEYTRAEDAVIGQETHVGPYTYLRPGTVIGEQCRIGDFVEIKNANIGDGTKVSHLSYVGDADLGKKINVGCGTVFVNYDGQNKYRSTIEDKAFLGCNSNYVAPVRVGENAYVAAGTTVTEDVPADALSIGRVKQTNKLGWAKDKSKK